MSIFGCFIVMTICFWSGYHLCKEVSYNKNEVKDDIEEEYEDYDEEEMEW